MQVNEKQWKALRAFCQALIHPIPGMDSPLGQTGASDNKTPERILAAADALPVGDQQELRILLNLLSSPMLGLTWAGPMKPFINLTGEQQQRLLQSWRLSRLGKLRQAFHSLRKLTTFHHYAYSQTENHPAWKSMGYPGPPLSEPRNTSSFTFLHPKEGETIRCEVLVIGSGAGGGLSAGMLANAGKDVCIVEKGPFLQEVEMSQREAEMVGKMYERGGSLVSKDGGITIFAGSTWGGGTTVNWAGSFRTPTYILEEWAKDHALPDLLGNSFQESMDAVWEALRVNSSESMHNPQNEALWKGSEQLGHVPKIIHRNTDGCLAHQTHECGWCGYGCRNGSKQSTLKNGLKWAAEKGAKLLQSTTIERILIEGGKAVGAQATYIDASGKPMAIKILAEKVIVAAGAIHTPALLHRSGIRHAHLGRHLYLHPTVAVSGQYPHPIEPWSGAMMTTLNDQFAQLSGNFGVRIETPPTHPGLMAMALPWTSAADHKDILGRSLFAANFIVLTRDKEGGQVKTDAQGQPIVHYRLSPFDRQHLIRGVQEAGRIHFAAGAQEVVFPNYRLQRLTGQQAQLLEDANRWGWGPNQVSLFSAHQMGTCRMGGHAQDAPVQPDGKVRNISNVWVVDGSTFPAASGANPMISIMTLAHFITKSIY